MKKDLQQQTSRTYIAKVIIKQLHPSCTVFTKIENLTSNLCRTIKHGIKFSYDVTTAERTYCRTCPPWDAFNVPQHYHQYVYHTVKKKTAMGHVMAWTLSSTQTSTLKGLPLWRAPAQMCTERSATYVASQACLIEVTNAVASNTLKRQWCRGDH